jgi:carbonic anhydrase
MTPLLERHERFASACAPASLAPPAAQELVVTCLDHRVEVSVSGHMYDIVTGLVTTTVDARYP